MNKKIFEWSRECEKAFELLKEYLTNPPLLSSTRNEEHFLVYLSSIDETVGATLVQAEANVHKPI